MVIVCKSRVERPLIELQCQAVKIVNISCSFTFMGSLGTLQPLEVKAAKDLAAFCKRLFSDIASELLEADVPKVFNVDFCLYYSYPRLRQFQKCELRFYNS